MPKSDRRRKGDPKLEVERMRLVACGVIAMANTRGSAAEVRSNISDKYKSDSLNHVMRAVDAEMRLREECDSLRLKLTSSLVREQVLILAMQKLSKLGNGDQPGNSDGNRIAQKALSDRNDYPSYRLCYSDPVATIFPDGDFTVQFRGGLLADGTKLYVEAQL